MGKYYGITYLDSDNSLSHHGILGQRWGIRRFQNEDGTLTDAGKKRYGSDPELNELHQMEQKEHLERAAKVQKPFKDQMNLSSSVLTKKDRALFLKVKNGEDLSAKEKSILRDAWKKYEEKNFDLDKQHISILKKYDAWSHNNPVPSEAQKKLDEIASQMSENRKALSEAQYAEALNEEHEYAKSIGERINNQTNKIPVDPAYRTFSSKEEKAKAEAEYMTNTWMKNPDEVSKEDEQRFIDECVHIQHKVTLMSMDGYSGIPKSERNKAMYDYEPRSDYDRFNSFDRYDNWIPKYEKTDEWQSLEKQRKQVMDESDYNRLNKEYHDATSNGIAKKDIEKLYRAMNKAYDERQNKLDAIRSKQRRIEEPFYNKIAKNVLLDIGYEVTPENIECIFQIIWSD